MWVRGLKLAILPVLGDVGVAPHVGAWIETGQSRRIPPKCRVAPHVGAWIETHIRSS